MLVLARKPLELILITTPEGREIAVALCSLESNQARIGIEADREVRILRAELADDGN
jgi:carbon storage regulator CsrA